MNARVKSQDANDCVRKYAEEFKNDSGERLLRFCSEHQLKVANTYIVHKNSHRYTWERPFLNQKSIFDYIIVKNNSMLKVFDARVQIKANCGTDHRMLMAKLLFFSRI